MYNYSSSRFGVWEYKDVQLVVRQYVLQVKNSIKCRNRIMSVKLLAWLKKLTSMYQQINDMQNKSKSWLLLPLFSK